jgi:tetratricopeptide (TPR) repeat protein
MKLRLLIRLSCPVLGLLLVPCVKGEHLCGGNDAGVESARAVANMMVPVTSDVCDRLRARTDDASEVAGRPAAEIPSRAEMLRRIVVYEEAARDAEAARASDVSLAKVFASLASLYESAAMYGRSEAALEHAISLLRRHPELRGMLATDLNFLGMLHGEMWKLRQAEKEEQEALGIRMKLEDSLDVARSWNALAEVYFKDRRYGLSREFAQRAMEEFAANRRAGVIDRITSRLNLALAQCYMKDFASAIPLLKETVAMAKASFKPNDFPVGEGEYLLGFAYWRSGDMDLASKNMEHGTRIMKEQLGWGHPTYLNALGQYAKFLRENRRVEDAEAVERQIRLAEAVVDVHSIQMGNGSVGLGGLH